MKNSFQNTSNLTGFEERRLLSVKELHQYLGLPISSIYTKKCRGLLPKKSNVKFKGSSKVFFDKQIIDEWIEESKPYGQYW